MPKILDITGQRFGSLTALKKVESRGGKTYLDETFLPPVNIKWVFSEAWD